jgi:hypothetical protein
VAWFDKARFSARSVVGTPLEHFGTEENRHISAELKKMDAKHLLPQSVPVNKEAVNIFIGTPTALKANLQFKVLKTDEEPTLGIKPCPDIYKAAPMYPAGLAVKIAPAPATGTPAPESDPTPPPPTLLSSPMTTLRHFG